MPTPPSCWCCWWWPPPRPASVSPVSPAILAASAGFDFFLTEPYNTLTIADPDDIATAVLLLLVSGLVDRPVRTTAGHPGQPGTRLPRRSHRHRGESGRRPVFHGQLIEQVARQVMQVDNPNFDPRH